MHFINVTSNSGGLSAPLFNKTGSQGDFWYRGIINVGSTKDDYEVVFEGISGKGWQGDIALDDISLTPGCQLCLDCKLTGIYII